MRKLLLASLLLIGCANKVEVPAKVEQCFKNTETGTCTNSVVVKHIITIELPKAFTDTCDAKYPVTEYPDPSIRDPLYQKCISDYISQLMSIIKGVNPSDLPPLPTGL